MSVTYADGSVVATTDHKGTLAHSYSYDPGQRGVILRRRDAAIRPLGRLADPATGVSSSPTVRFLCCFGPDYQGHGNEGTECRVFFFHHARAGICGQLYSLHPGRILVSPQVLQGNTDRLAEARPSNVIRALIRRRGRHSNAGKGWPGATALIAHWNGVEWRMIPGPVGTSSTALNGVAALSPKAVWAVGARAPSTKPVSLEPVVEYWNGRSWRRQPFSAPGVGLSGIAARGGQVWAVGSEASPGPRVIASYAVCPPNR